ncbi:MAG TPA: radical SAM protein [Thermoleophilaceae bacterium]|nr:radical SAM protein [Thermoleophilaceae bacterium]
MAGAVTRLGDPAPALPEELQVEVSGACNLRCRMCLVRYAPAISKREGALDLEQFLSLVDSLPRLRRLTLQGLGEPLLSPHLVEMVRHASARGAAVGFNTNGTLLDRASAERLVAAGLAWLHVSLDGATPETYEDVRHGTDFRPRPGQFERVVANLRGLVEVRRAAGSALPRIQLVFVAMRRNVAELPQLVRLAADVGVEEVRVQNLSHDFSDTDPAGAYEEIRGYAREEALFGAREAASELAEAAFEGARLAADETGIDLRLPRLEESAPGPRRAPGQPACGWPWQSAYVTHRAEVLPCCMVMGSERATLGDLHDESFEQIWSGGAYAEFRERLLGEEPPDVCRGCSLYRGVF